MSRLYSPARLVQVQANERGFPAALRWRGFSYSGHCLNHWRIHTRWWEEEVLRDYYLWESRDLLCEIYYEAFQGRWYMHRVYD